MPASPGPRRLPPQLRAVQVFVAETGRWPQRTAPFATMPWEGRERPRLRSERRWLDFTERELAIWLANQRQHCTDRRRALLDEHVPGWSEPHYARARVRFEDGLAALKRAVADGGRDRVLEDEDLVAWLKSVRYRGRTVSAEARAALDAVFPGWDRLPTARRRDRERFEDRLADLVRWREAHPDRWPSASSQDASERSLAHWRGHMLATADDARRARLDEALPGWDRTRGWTGGEAHPSRQVFAARLAELEALRAAGGDLSGRQHQALRNWLGMQRRNPRLSPDRRAALDRVWPGWTEPLPRRPAGGAKPRPDVFEQRLANLVRFREENAGAWPSTRSPLKAERSLGVWVREMRRSASDERRARLDALAPGWDVPRQAGGRGNIDEIGPARRVRQLKEFIETHGYRPGKVVSDPDQLALASWASVTRSRPGRMRDRVERLLDGVPTVYEFQWLQKAAELEKFVAQHGRLPRYASGEKHLYHWRRAQRDRATPERQAYLDEKIPGWRVSPGSDRRARGARPTGMAA